MVKSNRVLSSLMNTDGEDDVLIKIYQHTVERNWS